MDGRTIQVPRFLHIAPGALSDLPQEVVETFDARRVVLATGGGATGPIGKRLAASLRALGSETRVKDGLRGMLTEANQLLEFLDVERPTLVVAVGGGRPLDVAKLAAGRARIDLVTVPTSLSHDGMASPVASLTFPDGYRRSVGAGMPAGVAIDLDVVRSAPSRNLRAGVGDLASNLTAVLDWRLAHERTGEAYDEFASSLALQSSLPVLGVAWPPNDDDLEAIARGLVMSGLAMEIAGTSRPCSGADHLISHSLDRLLGPRALLHGEQVALGCLIAAVLHDSHLDAVRALFTRCGLPNRVDDWPFGLDVIVEAVQRAPGTRGGRYTVLDEHDLSSAASVRAMVRDALNVADRCPASS